MKTFIVASLGILLVFLIRGGSDKNQYKNSVLEVDKWATRTAYFGELGKVYRNRFGVYYFNNIYPKSLKLESVFFSSLDAPLIYLALYSTLLYLGLRKRK